MMQVMPVIVPRHLIENSFHLGNHHFDLVHAAYMEDEDTRDFIAEHNPAALREMAERFEEAIERGLWRPRSNSARALNAAILKREVTA